MPSGTRSSHDIAKPARPDDRVRGARTDQAERDAPLRCSCPDRRAGQLHPPRCRAVLGHPTRWPKWADEALRAGARSSLSVGLPVHDGVTGALNVYAVDAYAFDEDAVILARTFAGYAAVALANAHLYDATATLAQQMMEAMESRAVIEQAKGIIMGERRCTPDEAFAVLSKVSQDSNRKVRDVAVSVVAEAQRPPA